MVDTVAARVLEIFTGRQPGDAGEGLKVKTRMVPRPKGNK